MRKNIHRVTLAALLTTLLVGCGEESNKQVFGESTTDGIYTLNAGESSQVLKGDVLEPNSASTRIEIDHIIDDDTKYVTIIEGSATLLRGSYAVQ